MRLFITKLGVLFAALVALALPTGMALSASPAFADSTQCASAVTTHGTTGNFCASQELTTYGLELAIPNKMVTYSRLTFKTAGTNPQTDFQFYNPSGGSSDNAKVFEYSPRGVPSDLCMAVSNNGALPVLKTCNQNSAAQQWVANPDSLGGYEWASQLNGLVVTNPNGAQYTRAVLNNSHDTAGQSFTYEQ